MMVVAVGHELQRQWKKAEFDRNAPSGPAGLTLVLVLVLVLILIK
jgi:hypothetical protein